MNWTQPKCERCWVEAETTLEEGTIRIRRPSRIAEPEVETCAFCGELTISGIYVREDPRTLAYPKGEDQEVR